MSCYPFLGPNVFLDQSSTTTPCDQFTNIVEFTAEHHQPDLRLAVHNGDTCLTLAPVKINLDPCVMRRYGEYIEVFGDVTTTGRMGLAAIRVDVPRVRLSLAVPVIGVEGVLCDKMQEYTDRLAVHTENLHAEVRNGRIDIVADTIRCFLETRKGKSSWPFQPDSSDNFPRQTNKL